MRFELSITDLAGRSTTNFHWRRTLLRSDLIVKTGEVPQDSPLTYFSSKLIVFIQLIFTCLPNNAINDVLHEGTTLILGSRGLIDDIK